VTPPEPFDPPPQEDVQMAVEPAQPTEPPATQTPAPTSTTQAPLAQGPAPKKPKRARPRLVKTVVDLAEEFHSLSLEANLSPEARERLARSLFELIRNPQVPKATLEEKAEEIVATAD
jgi:hypothetical protein